MKQSSVVLACAAVVCCAGYFAYTSINCQGSSMCGPCKTPASSSSSVVKTNSGLAYEILTPGDAAKGVAKSGNHVTVHYTGWLLDESKADKLGKKFDSSVDRGTPFQFVLGGGMVIKGWDEGVQGMLVGEKRRLTLPSTIAYGKRGAGALIPGDATLVFDVELLAV